MSEGDGWVEFFKFAANAAVISLGWFVVHRLAIERENDKARKDLVGKVTLELNEALTKLFTAAHEYHTSERSIGSEIALKMALHDFALSVHALSYTISDQQTLHACLQGVIALRKSVTGRHFEDEHLHPLDVSDPQLNDIADAVSSLKREFVGLRHRQFSPSQAVGIAALSSRRPLRSQPSVERVDNERR